MSTQTNGQDTYGPLSLITASARAASSSSALLKVVAASSMFSRNSGRPAVSRMPPMIWAHL
jgi:hypothetical protein